MNGVFMKYIDEYRDSKLIETLARSIKSAAEGLYTFMEVCGGHTAAIHRFGIRDILPQNIRLISGPGCPVCVTGKDFIDRAIAMSGIDNCIMATYGDLMRVPGSLFSLEKANASGADIRVVFSALEALDLAERFPERKIIFLGIGFETTAPGTAVALCKAEEKNIRNFFVLSAHKLMPPAMEAIIKDGTGINGFICPGHVATITGSSAFEFISGRYGTACVVTGFEPVDILQSVLMLVNQVNAGMPAVEIQYTRAVTIHGNLRARKYLGQVFEPGDAIWRGLGIVPESGLVLRDRYGRFDASSVFPLSVVTKDDDGKCICGDILRGLRTPSDCTLFGKVCIPSDPVGACMVSDEGACNIFYRYGKHE